MSEQEAPSDTDLVERVFDAIGREHPFSPITRSDIAEWIELFARFGFSRAPQPVQAEVTDRVSISRTLARYAATALAGSGDNGDRYAAKQIHAALGGGDHE